MSHDELKGLVADLAIGALDGAEARLVEAHVAGCPECAAELRSLTGTAQLLRTLPPIPAPPAGEASLLDGARRAAARMAAPPAPTRRVPRWLLGLALGGAGAAAALLVSLQLGKAPASRFDEGRSALEGSGAPATVAAAPPAPSVAPLAASPAPSSAAPEGALAATPARELEEAKARRPEPAGGLGAAAPAGPSAPSAGGSLDRADTQPAPPRPAPPPAQPAPKRKAAPEEIGIGEPPRAAAPAPARADAGPAADAVAEAAATPQRDADRYAAPGTADLAQRVAPAPTAKATAKLEGTVQGAGAEDRARASSAGADAAPPAAAARLAKGQAEQGPAAPPPEIRRAPGCAGETRRTLWRDAAGRLVGREREGRLGGQAYRIRESFDAAGRLAAARLEAGGRTATADRAGVAEGRLAGLVPGLEVAVDAAAAEAAPPRCGP